MTPLDDELRSALRARAGTISPSPDPLVGIERRARGIRRRRIAGSVAGAALAVGAVVAAVPTLRAGSTPAPAPYTSTTPTPTPAASAYALDPSRPWDYRGDAKARGVLQDKAGGVWEDAHHVTDGQFQLLYGQFYEPAGRAEAVYLARTGGQDWWGVVQDTPSGLQLVDDQPLRPGTHALLAPLAGDEVPRLLVVTAPGTTAEYRHDPSAAPVVLRSNGTTIPGVGLEGDTSRDRVRVTAPGGAVVADEPAPDPSGGTAGTAPANVLDWPSRGVVPAGLLPAAEQAYARSRQQPTGQPSTKVLFAGVQGGARLLLAQMWLPGDPQADTVGYVEGPQGVELHLQSRVTPRTSVVVLVLSATGGRPTETLVVVPQPRTGQVLYAADGTTFRPEDTGFTPNAGVVTVQRDPRATADRLRLLDGDGRQYFEGTVFMLLCGRTSCG